MHHKVRALQMAVQVLGAVHHHDQLPRFVHVLVSLIRQEACLLELVRRLLACALVQRLLPWQVMGLEPLVMVLIDELREYRLAISILSLG